MSARNVIGKVLLFLALPFVFLGLIDPLEGGLALIAATLVYLAAHLLLKQAPAKILWIPMLATLVIGGITIVFALTQDRTGATSPMNIQLIVGMWLYRAAVVAALVGGLVTAIRSLRR